MPRRLNMRTMQMQHTIDEQKGRLDWLEWIFRRNGYDGSVLLKDWLEIQFTKRDLYEKEHNVEQ